MTLVQLFNILKEIKRYEKIHEYESIVLYNEGKYLAWKIVEETMSGTQDITTGVILPFDKEELFDSSEITAIKLTGDDEVEFVYDSWDGFQPYTFTKLII